MQVCISNGLQYICNKYQNDIQLLVRSYENKMFWPTAERVSVQVNIQTNKNLHAQGAELGTDLLVS
jgi:hypothetical protein